MNETNMHDYFGDPEIDRLEKEVERLRDQVRQLQEHRNEAWAQSDGLAPRDKKDAERYRWLRDQPDPLDVLVVAFPPYELQLLPADKWDTTIDSAMAGETED